jgi:hypothetical protein
MAEERRTRRPTLEQGAAGGLIVGVTLGGRLEWVVSETSADQSSASEVEQAAAESTQGTEIISAEEEALVKANREKIAEMRTRRYRSPDLGDVIVDMMGLARPSLSLAVAGWALQAIGLVPIPAAALAAMAPAPIGFIGRHLGRRLHAEQVPQSTSEGAALLWQQHAGLAATIVITLMDRVIHGIKNAVSVDDTQLEDELDAFYPHWSQTDFEFGPKRNQR